jgi:hypothetical protein
MELAVALFKNDLINGKLDHIAKPFNAKIILIWALF